MGLRQAQGSGVYAGDCDVSEEELEITLPFALLGA
jgi:hypothetical protein